MYIGPWQEYALSSRLPQHQKGLGLQNKPPKDPSADAGALQAQVDYLKKLLESKDVAPNVPKRQRNVNAVNSVSSVRNPQLLNPRLPRSKHNNKNNMAKNKAHGYSRILSNVSPAHRLDPHVLAFPPPMSARSHKSDATTLSEYSYTRSLPDVSQSAPGLASLPHQKLHQQEAPTLVGVHTRREVGGYNKNLAARMLKVTRVNNNKIKGSSFGASDSIRNMFNVSSSSKPEKVTNVEQVKLMREVYLNRKEDNINEKNKDNPSGNPKLEQLSSNPAAQPSPPKPAAVDLPPPETVKDMSLTEKEFDQVSKYFTLEDLTDSDNKDVSPFFEPRTVSPLRIAASPPLKKESLSSPSFRVDMDTRSPPTPAAGGSTVDELINWVGGLDLKEI